MSAVLSVRNLKKIYQEKTPRPAVDQISFDLMGGEILGLLGPNGSGKTTTIQMLLGTLSVTSGTIIYFGKDFQKHRSDILESISYASTYNSLPWLLTVEENLEFLGRLYGLNSKESRKQFTPLLERFGLLGKSKMKVSNLSSGQVTRLMLVKAFFIKPKIVLLDEPTASLDPDVAQEICDFILEQRKETGLSILFTSHKMEEVAKLCDRIIFLKEGKIVANDVPKILAQSISSFRLKLVIVDKMEQVEGIVRKDNLIYKIDNHTIEITLGENIIPLFLNKLSLLGISYANIRIEEPSLEDYFLQIARS